MKPSFEISKNKIITYLLAFIWAVIFIVALVAIPRVIKWENAQKASKTENADTIATVGYIKSDSNLILYDGITRIQAENDMLARENSRLKKKVNYYFEYYRKNQPVGITVAPDTIPYPYWDKPYKLVPLDSSWIHSDSIMFEMDGDTFYFPKRKYMDVKNKQIYQ